MPDRPSGHPVSRHYQRVPRVLCVDDEPIMLRTIRRLLKWRHPEWELITVESALEALAVLGRCEVDVIVSDLRMPGMSGRELLERVRARYPDVVRVIHSAHVDSLPPGGAVPLAHRTVAKPAGAGELLDATEWAIEIAASRRREDRSTGC